MRRLKRDTAAAVDVSRETVDVSNEVEALSGKLNSVMQDANAQAAKQVRATAKQVVFESANAPVPYKVGPGVQYVVDHIFVLDDEIVPLFKELTQALSAGNRRVEHAFLLEELDLADHRAWQARRLYATLRHQRDVWERKNDVRFAAIRHEAHRVLQEEKDRKERSKQITDKDLDTCCAEIAPDEWESLERERSQMKHTEEAAIGLVEAWASRARSLQSMFGKSR